VRIAHRLAPIELKPLIVANGATYPEEHSLMHESVYRMLAWYMSYDLAGRTRDWLKRDRGANAVEYTLILVAVAGGIVLLVITLGTRIKFLFQRTCTDINGGTACG
jgi:Flp pilus assembly pilin Flp